MSSWFDLEESAADQEPGAPDQKRRALLARDEELAREALFCFASADQDTLRRLLGADALEAISLFEWLISNYRLGQRLKAEETSIKADRRRLKNLSDTIEAFLAALEQTSWRDRRALLVPARYETIRADLERLRERLSLASIHAATHRRSGPPVDSLRHQLEDGTAAVLKQLGIPLRKTRGGVLDTCLGIVLSAATSQRPPDDRMAILRRLVDGPPGNPRRVGRKSPPTKQ